MRLGAEGGAALVALAAVFAVGGCDSTAQPSEPSLPAPSIISGSVQLSSGAAEPAPSTRRPGEPSVATQPGNPLQLVAGWIENQSPDRVGITVALSHNGGASWSRSPLPGLLTWDGGR